MVWKKGQEVRLMPPSQASGRVLEIYHEMQGVLGVPHISSFFQFLGTHPRFLEQFWSAIRPLAQSEEFSSCAARLRAEAYNRVRSSFQVPDLRCELTRQEFSPAACDELRDCIIFFSYAVPSSLVLAAYLSRTFEGGAGSAIFTGTPAPAHPPHRRIVLVDEDSAAPAVKAIFSDIRFSTAADVIHTVYRAFARWPGFLQSYWSAAKPIVVSEQFQAAEVELREKALRATDELPGRVEFTPATMAQLGIDASEADSIVSVTKMFVHSLAAALLNVSVARISMESSTASKQPDVASKA